MSVSNYGETFLLNSLPGEMYVKLHTGDPGEDGTAAAAGETTRKKVSFATAGGTNTRKSSTAAEWTNVSTSETYSYVSLWDAVSGGNCLWIIPLTEAKAVSKEDNFTLKAEQLTVSLD